MSNYESLIKKYDKSNMFEMISGFSGQIHDSIKFMENWSTKKNYSNIETVLITGMGGSAIGGDFVSAILSKECAVSISVNRCYNIPGWVNEKTLVIASSYSGNTEETISAFKLALERKCQIICVTTGGELEALAVRSNLDIVPVPKNLQPRAALGHSLTLNLLLLEKTGIIVNDQIKSQLLSALTSLENWQEQLQIIKDENQGCIIAEKIENTFPIIYAGTGWTSVCALRFRGQLAENSKMLSSYNIFPEQNHNEIEGWTCYPEIIGNTSIVWLKDRDDHVQIQKRMQITKELLHSIPSAIIEVEMTGKTPLGRMLKLIHLLDWVSYYAALINKVDPSPVNRITQLKTKLVDK